MSIEKVILNPGVNTQATMLLNETMWAESNLIRFKDKMLQKLDGWAKFITTALSGKCRSLKSWADLSGNLYLAAGTNSRVELVYGGVLYDITPLRATANLTTPYTTANTSTEIRINDVAHGAAVGDGIYLVNPIAVGGLILFGWYSITVVDDADNYRFTAASAATATAAAAGAAAAFATTNTSTTVTVTLANHGYSINNIYTVYISTTVGGLTLLGEYVVQTVPTANTFTITASSAATSTTTGSENGGNSRVTYLLASGGESATPAEGWGIGGWGGGYWGIGDPGAPVAPRVWHMVNWGEDLIANPTDGTLYLYDTSAGLTNNPMTEITQSPDKVIAIFLAMPQRQIVALGCWDGVAQDRLLINWCDVDDYTVWTGTSENQAGTYRIPRGSRIVGGLQGPQQGMVWTDTSLWVMQYIGPPLVYGFNEIASGCGLIGSKAVGVLGSKTYWMGPSNFYVYDGSSVVNIPCSVYDFIFGNLNLAQVDKITCAVSSSSNEVTWYFPSNDGDENDLYVKLNADEGVWDYGTLDRTAWLDDSIFQYPVGAGADSYIFSHETGFDDDTAAMESFAKTGWFRIAEGRFFMYVDRMFPDLILSDGAEVEITIEMSEFANGSNSVIFGPYTVDAMTNYVMIRARGKFASIKIASSDLGSFWRLGEFTYLGSVAGSR